MSEFDLSSLSSPVAGALDYTSLTTGSGGPGVESQTVLNRGVKHW